MRTTIFLGFLASLVLVVTSKKDLVTLLTTSLNGNDLTMEVNQLTTSKLKVCMIIKNEDCDPGSPPPLENNCITNPIRDCSCFTDKLDATFSFQREIQPHPNGEKFMALCDSDGEGNIWTAIMYREGETYGYNADWNRNYSSYWSGFSGFGLSFSYDKDFFLGLNRIQALTNAADMQVKFELNDEDYNKYEVYYNNFHVAGPGSQFKLTIGSRNNQLSSSGVITSFEQSNGKQFSAPENDNSENCAQRHQGGWWFPDTTATIATPSCSKFNAVGPGPIYPASDAGKFSFDVNGVSVPASALYMFVAPMGQTPL